MLLIWEIWRQQKDILKLTDLYKVCNKNTYKMTDKRRKLKKNKNSFPDSFSYPNIELHNRTDIFVHLNQTSMQSCNHHCFVTSQIVIISKRFLKKRYVHFLIIRSHYSSHWFLWSYNMYIHIFFSFLNITYIHNYLKLGKNIDGNKLLCIYLQKKGNTYIYSDGLCTLLLKLNLDDNNKTCFHN